MMFSNDQNIETIGQLVELIRHYIGLQNEYLRLDVIEKVVRLITALVMAAVVFRGELVARSYHRVEVGGLHTVLVDGIAVGQQGRGIAQGEVGENL